MLGARYRKACEQRDRKAREARIRRFVSKRSRMHWGMYSEATGNQFPCTYTTVAVRIHNLLAEVDIAYRYKVEAKAAEFYFPMSEVGQIKSIVVSMKQASSSIQEMQGCLYEQLEDGTTRPYQPEEAAESDDEAETASLLGGFWGGGKKKAAEKPPPRFYYFFGVSPELKELEVGTDLLVKVKYTVPCHREKQRFDDNDLITFVLPLTIFTESPNRWTITVEMSDLIRRIRPKLPSQRVWSDLQGRRAAVGFHDGYKIPLEDEYLILLIELGEPIEPRCADPVAIFIFATFVGLMVWFSLTKDLH